LRDVFSFFCAGQFLLISKSSRTWQRTGEQRKRSLCKA